MFNLPSVFFKPDKDVETDKKGNPTPTEDERMLPELMKAAAAAGIAKGNTLKGQASAEVDTKLAGIDAYFVQTKEYTVEKAGAYECFLRFPSCRPANPP